MKPHALRFPHLLRIRAPPVNGMSLDDRLELRQ